MPASQISFALTGLDTYAVMVLCAQDATSFFDQIKDTNAGGNPTFPPAVSGVFAYLQDPQTWEPLGQLRADDDIVLKIDDCYFGLVLRCKKPLGPFLAGDLLVGVKGTSDLREWLDDGASVFETHGAPNTPGDVANGFWKIYQTLTFADLTNTSKNADPAKAICNLLEGEASLYVVGHSLGAALATYLAYDLVQNLGPKSACVKPYFFASPKTGTTPNVQNYLKMVPFYNLVDYQNDLVPKLPFEIEGFSALLGGGPMHNAMTLRPNGQSYVPHFWDVSRNHSAVLYARLLDPTNAVAARLPI